MVKFLQVPPREADLMRKWREEGKGISEIMKLTGRAKQTVISHTTPQKKPRIGSRRRKIITAPVFKKLLKTMQSMQKKANATKEISVASIKKKAGVQDSDRVILQEFHANDIWFRPLRQKPILEDEDVIARRAFADKYRTRSVEGWVEQPQAIIDNKNFPIYQRDKDRNEAARRQVRGGYRRRGDLPKPFLVKRKPQMKYSAPSVQVTAAIVKGKVRKFVRVREGQLERREGRANVQRAASHGIAQSLSRESCGQEFQVHSAGRQRPFWLQKFKGRRCKEGGRHHLTGSAKAQPRPQPARLFHLEDDQRRHAQAGAKDEEDQA